MIQRVLSYVFVLAALVILVPPASATTPYDPPDPSSATLTPCQGGGTAFCWQNFMWNSGPGGVFQTYTLDLTAQAWPTELRITDGFAGGDMFTVTVSDNSAHNLTLSTSLVPKTATTAVSYVPTYYPTTAQNDPDAAWISHYHSKLALWLPVGCGGCLYTIQIKLAQSAISGTTALNGGRGFIRAEYYQSDANGNIIPPGGVAGPGVLLPADASTHRTMAPEVASPTAPKLPPLDVNGRIFTTAVSVH